MKEQLDIEIMTYDALISWYRSDYRYLKNVLAYTKGQFRFKKPVSDGSSLFAYLTPSVLLLSEEDEQILRSQGYQIDAWKAGEPLSFNDRFPLRKDADGKWSLRPY
ncbi:hypothetical protein ASF03_13750 [Rhizobium sp. Leaf68]|nr:hypothetical protein ASE62_13070 [Rhizobium sp. Leaf202]KQN84313.1 hypothetical protein ASF03_13750 [Rhizobium sp. Leaf68]